MQIGIISLFPEMFEALNYGVTGRALERQLLTVHHWNPRVHTHDVHHTVDDRPYGGGPGMVMLADPLFASIAQAKATLGETTPVIYLSPQGKPLDQQAIERFSLSQSLILLSGRYEGIDERVIETAVTEEWSLGDYILSGGELAAMVIIDAIARLLPGTLGDEQSAQQDSFSNGILDCPHYTRPEILDSGKVPSVLTSGNHAKIARWRLKQALGRTWLRRPDLLAKKILSQQEQGLLQEFILEHKERKS